LDDTLAPMGEGQMPARAKIGPRHGDRNERVRAAATYPPNKRSKTNTSAVPTAKQTANTIISF